VRVPLVAAIVAAVWTVSAHAAVSQTLYGGFTADGVIELNFADGSQIGTPNAPGTSIPAGTYQLILNNNTADDVGVDHTFHLTGPGVDVKPSAGQVQSTFTITFQPNATYVYQDDLHPVALHMVFNTNPGGTATTTPATTTPVKSTAPASSGSVVGSAVGSLPFRGALAGTVAANGKLVLAASGRTVTTLKAGSYRITVKDASAKAGFRLQKLHKSSVTHDLTTPAFVGTKTATVKLVAGQWVYASPGGARSYFIVIG
jgi:hypothetical protein